MKLLNELFQGIQRFNPIEQDCQAYLHKHEFDVYSYLYAQLSLPSK
jgi:hypothetical protein